MIFVRNNVEIEKMRAAGKVVGDCLRYIEGFIKPGVSSLQLNSLIEDFIRSKNAIPSFLNYNGFPASACISPNDIVVHGIPSAKTLNEGDIVSVDVGAIVNGYHGDAARTFAVGKISESRQRLIDITRESFFEGTKEARAGRRLGDVSNAIQKFVEKNGYSIVRVMVGHGIGKNMHEEPSIPNFGAKGSGVMLKSGYCLAIEPMVNAGDYNVKFDADRWTCRTSDGSDSAHYENTIVVTNDSAEILTL